MCSEIFSESSIARVVPAVHFLVVAPDGQHWSPDDASAPQISSGPPPPGVLLLLANDRFST